MKMPNLSRQILTALLALAILFSPGSSYAIETISGAALFAKEYGLDTLATMAAQIMLKDLTKSTVKWINSGFKDGNPFVPENYNKWAMDAADKTGGDFFDKLTNGGYSRFCSFEGFNFGLSLPRAEKFELKTKCTLSQFGRNWDAIRVKAKEGDWSTLLQISQPQNNPYGLIIFSAEEKNRLANDRWSSEKSDLELNKGFLSQRKEIVKTDMNCVKTCEEKFSGTEYAGTTYQSDCNKTCETTTYETVTPGGEINAQLGEALGGGWKRLEAADELDEVLGALVNLAINGVRDGLVKTRRDSTAASSSRGAYGVEKVKTIDDLANEVFRIKTGLYDYKILAYDIAFKPGSNTSSTCAQLESDYLNDETCDPEAREVYKELYKLAKKDAQGISITGAYDADCASYVPTDINAGNFDEAGLLANCGVLAYNTKKMASTTAASTYSYNGLDIIAKTPASISPRGATLRWYRSFSMKRLNTMFDEILNSAAESDLFNAEAEDLYALDSASEKPNFTDLDQALAKLASERGIESSSKDSGLYTDPVHYYPHHVICSWDGTITGYDDSMALMTENQDEYTKDIEKIDKFFSSNGSYYRLLKLAKEIELSIKELKKLPELQTQKAADLERFQKIQKRLDSGIKKSDLDGADRVFYVNYEKSLSSESAESTDDEPPSLDDIAQDVASLKTAAPKITEEFIKRNKALTHYNKKRSCVSASSATSTLSGLEKELACLAEAENKKKELNNAVEFGSYYKNIITSIYGTGAKNMHCAIDKDLRNTIRKNLSAPFESALKDTDTCNNNKEATYSCKAGEIKTCVDVYYYAEYCTSDDACEKSYKVDEVTCRL